MGSGPSPGQDRGLAGEPVATHVGGSFGIRTERGEQAEALLRLVTGFGRAPAVVGCDLNATPEMRVPARIAAGLSDAWAAAGRGAGSTFPASRPEKRIDYVFVSGPLEIGNASVGGEGSAGASDHLPVCVDVAFVVDRRTTTSRGRPEPGS